MKRKHLKALMMINVALILLYMGLSYYDGYYNLPLDLNLTYYRYIAIAGSIVNIVALLVMWFTGTRIKKIMKAFSILFAICIVSFILSIPTNSFLFLLPMSAIFVFLYSIVFNAFAWCLSVSIDKKNYSYIGFLIVPTMGILIFLRNALWG